LNCEWLPPIFRELSATQAVERFTYQVSRLGGRYIKTLIDPDASNARMLCAE